MAPALSLLRKDAVSTVCVSGWDQLNREVVLDSIRLCEWY